MIRFQQVSLARRQAPPPERAPRALIHTAAPALQRHCHAGPVLRFLTRDAALAARARPCRAVPRAGSELQAGTPPFIRHARRVARGGTSARPVSASTMIRFQQVSRARVTLLDKADLLNPGDKIGLIGANGAGSPACSLLRACCTPTRATWTTPATWRMAHVAQETPALDRPAIEYAIDGDATLRQLEAELAALEAEPESAENGLRMAEIYAALADADAYTAHSRAEQLLTGLGFTQEQMRLPLTSFSGGWRMRLNLAQALMCPSDLLLLDEPTNHLDLDAIIWLEDWPLSGHAAHHLARPRLPGRSGQRRGASTSASCGAIPAITRRSSASAPRSWCWPRA